MGTVDAIWFSIHGIVTLGFACYMVFKVYKPLKLDPSTPSMLTTLGILGTFAGIFLGLCPFIFAVFQKTDISENIPHLIGGIAVAAICSICGMSLALRAKNKQRVAPNNITEEQHTGATADTLADLLQQLVKHSESQNTNLLALQKALVGDDEGTLLTQLQKIRTSFTDKQDQLIQSFALFADNMTKSNSEALITALQEVIKDFNTKISEQFGENFKHLNEAVGRLLEWQENYRTNMEVLQTQFNQCLDGLQTSKEALGKIAEKSDSMVQAAGRLEQLLVAYDGHRDQLANHLEAFASLSKEAKDAFPVIQQNLLEVIDHFSNVMDASREEHNKMLEKQQSAVSATILKFETLETQTAAHTEKVFKAMEEQADHLTSQLEETMNQTSKRLEKQVTAIDTALEEELTKSLNSLGNQLASLSGKFVSDYTPLTVQLEKLIRMTPSAPDGSDNQPWPFISSPRKHMLRTMRVIGFPCPI